MARADARPAGVERRAAATREATAPASEPAKRTIAPVAVARTGPGRTTADRLLDVVASGDAAERAPVQSPFIDAGTPATAGNVSRATAAASPVATGSRTSWTSRLLGLAAGMGLAGQAAGDLQAFGRRCLRRREDDEVGAAELPGSLASATTDTFEVRAELASGDSDRFSFHTPRGGAGDAVAPGPAIEVGTLETTGFTDIMRSLDDATQQMLEADYEAELTQTQRIAKETAERALREGGAGRAGVSRQRSSKALKPMTVYPSSATARVVRA